MFLYKGPATDMSHMSKEESQKVAEQWSDWMESVGDALVEVGMPMVDGIAIVDDGTEDTATDLNGYSIVKAESIEEARKLAHDHPFLSEESGDFSIEIHELAPPPF